MKKTLLFIVLLMTSVVGKAQSSLEWAMVVDGTQQKVLMSDVAYLLASDKASTFHIVCANGTIISEVASVSFEEVNPTGVSLPEQKTAPQVVLDGDAVTLSGLAAGTSVGIYTVEGQELSQRTVTGGETTMNIAGLPAGVYLLRTGKTTVKFMKR